MHNESMLLSQYKDLIKKSRHEFAKELKKILPHIDTHAKGFFIPFFELMWSHFIILLIDMVNLSFQHTLFVLSLKYFCIYVFF